MRVPFRSSKEFRASLTWSYRYNTLDAASPLQTNTTTGLQDFRRITIIRTTTAHSPDPIVVVRAHGRSVPYRCGAHKKGNRTISVPGALGSRFRLGLRDFVPRGSSSGRLRVVLVPVPGFRPVTSTILQSLLVLC